MKLNRLNADQNDIYSSPNDINIFKHPLYDQWIDKDNR